MRTSFLYPLGRAFELCFEIDIFRAGARDFFVIGCDKSESGRLPEPGYLQLFFFGQTGIWLLQSLRATVFAAGTYD